MAVSQSFAKQPKPFYLVFLLEVWERFGYYGVQALLVLYMVQKLGFKDTHADLLFTAFSAMVYILPSVGGYLGDKVIGTKRAILLGAIFLALGYMCLSIPFISNQNLLIPLAIIAVGNGFFKANPSSLLSKVYEKTGHNLDSGFTLYYMAINIGALISMNLTPILSAHFGWHTGFLVCFLGLLVAIISFFVFRRTSAQYGSEPDRKPLHLGKLAAVLLGAVIAIGVVYVLLTYYHVMSTILAVATVVSLLVYFGLITKAKEQERKGMWLFVFMFIQAIIFFVLYFQMPTSLTLFALRNVHHQILGFIPFQAAQFQVLNPAWILILSPILAAIYHKLHSKNRDLSIPTKFSLGTLLAGLAFVILPLGGGFANHGIISGNWLVLSYAIQSAGELLVSALGLSMAARYVPERFMGFTMGLWFLSTSIASIIAGHLASFASVPKGISNDPSLSLPIYNHLFWKIGLVTIAISIVMFAFVPLLKKLTSGDRQKGALDEELIIEEM